MESSESSGCAEASQAVADEMATRYRADRESFCSYGTTWLVLADGNKVTFDRVLGELQRDGWEEVEVPFERRSGVEALELPSLNETIDDEFLQPYVVVDSERFELQLNAGSNPS